MNTQCDQHACDGQYIVAGVCDGNCDLEPTHYVYKSSQESYRFCDAHHQFYLHGSFSEEHHLPDDPFYEGPLGSDELPDHDPGEGIW